MLLGCFNNKNVFASEGGYSNYIPGFYGDLALAVAPDDGLSMRNDVYYYGAEASKSVRSGNAQVEVDIELNFDYLTFLYKPGVEIWGGQYAFGGTAVYGKMDIDAQLNVGSTSIGINDKHTGLGDLTLTPAIIYWNKGNYHWAWMNYIVIPTGDFDKDETANTSLNYWTFETDFALTYLNLDKGQDYSLVVGYGYNTENDDTDYQSGDEVHVDFVLNQFLSESFAIGIHGFYYKQIGADSGDGALLGDFKAEASGLGPAFQWIPKKYGGKVALIAKWIKETHAENRLEGDHVFLSVAMSF
jgi:hypothetical protein